MSISSTLSLITPSFSYTPLLLPPSITSVSISSTLSLTISLLQLHSSSSSSFYNQCEYLLHFKFNHLPPSVTLLFLLPPSITSVSISSTLSLTISLLQLHSSPSSSFYNQCEYLLHFKFNHPLLQLHSSSSSSFYNQCEYLLHFKFNHPLLQLHSSPSSSFYNQCEYLLHFKFNHLPPSVTLLFFFLLL